MVMCHLGGISSLLEIATNAFCLSLNSFEQFDVVMPKKRLTSFGLAVTQERWPFFLLLLKYFIQVDTSIEQIAKLTFPCFNEVCLLQGALPQ